MLNTLATLRENFSPLRIRNFRIYLGGQAVSLIGTFLQSTAQSWVVWQLTGSNANIGTVTALSYLPMLLLGPWTGTLADRLDRRKVLILTQIGAMFLAFILAFLVLTNTVQLWHVYILAFSLGVVTAIDLPAQQAFLGDLSGLGELRRAVNLNVMMIQVSRVIGPALAGVVVSAVGAGTAFLLNGVSFFAVVLSLLAVHAAQHQKPKADNDQRDGGFGAVIRFVRQEPRVQDLLIFVAIVTFLAMSLILNLLAGFADTVFNGDADTYGLLMAASGAGALIGVLFVAPLVQVSKRIGLVFVRLIIWMGVWFIVLSQTTSLPVAMLALAGAGIGGPSVVATAIGLLQVLSPVDMRARTMSLFSMLSFGMQPMAAVLVGISGDLFGVTAAARLNGILLIVSVVVMVLLRPSVRTWEQEVSEKPELMGEELFEPAA